MTRQVDSDSVTLSENEQYNSRLTWDTSDTEPGEYTVTVQGENESYSFSVEVFPESGIARYEFEESVVDSWNDNDLIDNTSAGYTSNAQVGSFAKLFDGTDDYLSSPFNFDSSEDFSVAGWVYFSSFTGDFQPIFAQRETSFQDVDWQFHLDTSGSSSDGWVLLFGEGGAAQYSNSNINAGDATTGQWYHVGVTKGGDQWTLYTDGSEQFQITDSTGWTTTEELQLGAWQSGDSVLDGRLDHVSWYSKELSSNEISNHFNSGTIY